MTGEIINAVCAELQALFANSGNTVLRDTSFDLDQMPLYTMPCVVFSMQPSNDAYQFIGGSVSGEWDISLQSYFYDFNSALSNDNAYSTEAYNIVEILIEHFGRQTWITPEMNGIVSEYDFKMTLNGAAKETSLKTEGGGMIPSFALNYNSIAVNKATQWVSTIETTSQSAKGFVLTDKEFHDYIWQAAVISRVSNAEFIEITPINVGDRYYISDQNTIKQVETVDEITGKVILANSTPVEENYVFFVDSEPEYAFVYLNGELFEAEALNVE